jgi:leucyl-tRNA synthetase
VETRKWALFAIAVRSGDGLGNLAADWQQVDLYMGGSEHATGHLLYFRFWTKFLHDRGWIPFDEPAKKLVNQGMIQGRSAGVMRFFLRRDDSVPDNIPAEQAPSVFYGLDLHELLLEPQHPDFKRARQYVIDYLAQNYNVNYPEGRVHPEFSVGRPDFFNQAILVPIDCLEDDEITLNVERLRENSAFRSSEFLTWNGRVVCMRQVEKMSKSKFNVVNPDDIILKYGADTLRLYEMFLGPIEQSKPWDTNGIEGTFRFLRKFWNLFYESDVYSVSDEAPTKAEFKVLHATLKKVTEDIEKMSFNTSVAQFMIAVNQLGELKCHKRDVLEPLTIALAPFAPHIAEELWQLLDHPDSITTAPWPKWDAQYLVEDNFSYPISFNGKTRLQLEFPIALDAKSVEEAVLANPEVQQRLEGKAPKKVIVVPKRIVNIVV